MKHKCDVLIIGQGIAGSCLAYCLLQQGLTVQIIASPSKPNASKIAGGLMQRVSGQYLSLPQLVQDHFDEAVSFYKSLNMLFNAPIITKHPTYRILDDAQHKIWEKKRKLERYQGYLGQSLTPITINGTNHTGVDIYDTYSVNPSLFLTSLADYFHEHTMLHNGLVTEADLHIKQDSVHIHDFQADYVIFCVGSSLIHWSLFQDFPIINSKGDILTLAIDHHENRIIQHDKWLIPLQKHLFKFGSTYAIDPSIMPTQLGYEDLLSSLTFLGYKSCRCLMIESGHRCTFTDYQPSMGFLANNPRIGVFSGFSSKGFITAPSLAKQWSITFPDFSHHSLAIHRFFNH
ncbi:hypothetical protein DID74_00560 [Candidatus Marinamargulisbacteria bacterium SCGC AG-333-B06]|nr:hypothetical protein DID74_00560 [Candidatus Marinamargulisbacteria bacterium SCGC AG-333-B06]